mmetsp:Transcript_38645/g.82348  ORF Transcript_38645/g.82348 Transcript_38645/m.82348 type:complete len:238 (+) Transcript_38645:698-1411(+)
MKPRLTPFLWNKASASASRPVSSGISKTTIVLSWPVGSPKPLRLPMMSALARIVADGSSTVEVTTKAPRSASWRAASVGESTRKAVPLPSSVEVVAASVTSKGRCSGACSYEPGRVCLSQAEQTLRAAAVPTTRRTLVSGECERRRWPISSLSSASTSSGVLRSACTASGSRPWPDCSSRTRPYVARLDRSASKSDCTEAHGTRSESAPTWRRTSEWQVQPAAPWYASLEEASRWSK